MSLAEDAVQVIQNGPGVTILDHDVAVVPVLFDLPVGIEGQEPGRIGGKVGVDPG